MKIGKININQSNVTFAEKIESLTFNESSGISEMQFNALVAELKQLDTSSTHHMSEEIIAIKNEPVAKTKTTRLEKLRRFLIQNGVAIAQNLSASVLYDILKTL